MRLQAVMLNQANATAEPPKCVSGVVVNSQLQFALTAPTNLAGLSKKHSDKPAAHYLSIDPAPGHTGVQR